MPILPMQTSTDSFFHFEAGDNYALPMRYLKAVVRWKPPTKLKGLPAHFKGVANIRGAIFLILDLAEANGHALIAESPHLILAQEENIFLGSWRRILSG